MPRRILVLGYALLAAACLASPHDEGPANQQASGEAMFSESEAYERFMGRWSRKLASPFLEFTGLEDNDKVLDVGSGTGALAASILSRSRSVQVVGVDPSTAYVEYAQSRTSSDRATFETGDAQALRFEDDSFDRALALLVINFIPDPHKALGEMIRVTRPGGVVGAAVWDYGDGMEMLRVFWDEAVALDTSAMSRDERNMPFCTPEELRDLWEGSGLINVQVEPIVIELKFDSFDDFWAPFLEGQGPAGNYVASLSQEEQQRLQERLQKRLRAESSASPLAMRARAWSVKGLVPKTSRSF